MTRSPFPSGVAFVERWDPSLDPETFPMLLDGEADSILAATPTRRAEFAWGRWCARQALATLGEPAVAILSGPRREPLWPVGTVGSITHCRGYVAAAVGQSSEFAGLGLDAEPRVALSPGDAEAILSAGEADRVRLSELPWAAVVHFVGKEAVFKALYPICRAELDFLDVELQVDWRDGAFAARLVGPGSRCVQDAIQGVTGRFRVDDSHVLAGALLLPSPAPFSNPRALEHKPAP